MSKNRLGAPLAIILSVYLGGQAIAHNLPPPPDLPPGIIPELCRGVDGSVGFRQWPAFLIKIGNGPLHLGLNDQKQAFAVLDDDGYGPIPGKSGSFHRFTLFGQVPWDPANDYCDSLPT